MRNINLSFSQQKAEINGSKPAGSQNTGGNGSKLNSSQIPFVILVMNIDGHGKIPLTITKENESDFNKLLEDPKYSTLAKRIKNYDPDGAKFFSQLNTKLYFLKSEISENKARVREAENSINEINSEIPRLQAELKKIKPTIKPIVENIHYLITKHVTLELDALISEVDLFTILSGIFAKFEEPNLDGLGKLPYSTEDGKNITLLDHLKERYKEHEEKKVEWAKLARAAVIKFKTLPEIREALAAKCVYEDWIFADPHMAVEVRHPRR